MKRQTNFDAHGQAGRIEHSSSPEPNTIHEVDAEDLEELAPWEDPVQHIRATAERQAHQEQQWKQQEQHRTSEEIARLARRQGMSHETRLEEMKQRQIVDLRNREMRLQNQLNDTKWWQFGEKARLKSALQLTVERLNGLSETTPDQRLRQRQQSVKETVCRETIRPMAIRERNLRDRISVGEPATAQEQMHQASARRDSAWTRFASIFSPSIRGKARGETYAATHAHAIEHRVNRVNDDMGSQERKDAA